MREIKFRGKLKEKGMSGWIEGSLVHITRTYKGEEDEQECDIYQIINDDGVGFFIDKETIGQFTGLKDKNRKEIYEGDILQGIIGDIKVKGILGYSEAEATYIIIQDNNDEWDLGYLDNKEVIGNIYDNPELLKGADNIE